MLLKLTFSPSSSCLLPLLILYGLYYKPGVVGSALGHRTSDADYDVYNLHLVVDEDLPRHHQPNIRQASPSHVSSNNDDMPVVAKSAEKLNDFQREELVIFPGEEDEMRVRPDGSMYHAVDVTTSAKDTFYPYKNLNGGGDNNDGDDFYYYYEYWYPVEEKEEQQLENVSTGKLGHAPKGRSKQSKVKAEGEKGRENAATTSGIPNDDTGNKELPKAVQNEERIIAEQNETLVASTTIPAEITPIFSEATPANMVIIGKNIVGNQTPEQQPTEKEEDNSDPTLLPAKQNVRGKLNIIEVAHYGSSGSEDGPSNRVIQAVGGGRGLQIVPSSSESAKIINVEEQSTPAGDSVRNEKNVMKMESTTEFISTSAIAVADSVVTGEEDGGTPSDKNGVAVIDKRKGETSGTGLIASASATVEEKVVDRKDSNGLAKGTLVVNKQRVEIKDLETKKKGKVGALAKHSSKKSRKSRKILGGTNDKSIVEKATKLVAEKGVKFNDKKSSKSVSGKLSRDLTTTENIRPDYDDKQEEGEESVEYEEEGEGSEESTEEDGLYLESEETAENEKSFFVKSEPVQARNAKKSSVLLRRSKRQAVGGMDSLVRRVEGDHSPFVINDLSPRRTRQTVQKFASIPASRSATKFPSEFCKLDRDSGIICPKINRGIFLDQFYYDSDINRCAHFIYNGCGGNANRFSTLWECTQYCGKRHDANNPYNTK